MRARNQLPVYSPVGSSAVAASLSSAAGGEGVLHDLERVLERTFSATSTILCGSGTQALQLAITLARETAGPDSIIALPAFNCYDVASAALGAGGRIALYDIDPTTLTPDLESLERCLVAGARVIVVACLYGVPIPWEPISSLVSAHGATLIEDAAQGHGAAWHGARLGSLADISTVSFGRGKGWTGGGGGAVLLRRRADKPILLEDSGRAGAIMNVVKLTAQQILGRPALYGVPRAIPGLRLGETTFHPPVPPRGMSASSAGALLVTEGASNAEPVVRRENARRFHVLLRDNDRVRRIPVASGGTPGYLRMPLYLRGGLAAFGDAEIAVSLGMAPSYPIPLVELEPLRKSLVAPQEKFPGAQSLATSLITLPVHSLVSREDMDAIATLIASASSS